MSITKKAKSRVIGFAMDAGEMRAVELSGTAWNCRVTAFGAAALPRGLINEGSLADIPALGQALSKLLRDNGFSGSAPMMIGVKNQNVILRMATYPSLPEDKLQKAVMLQAQQFIPVPVSELMLDFVECDVEHKEGAQDTVNILLVGAKKAYLDDVLEMCGIAGRTVADIDSAVLANFRAVAEIHDEPDHDTEPSTEPEPSLYAEAAVPYAEPFHDPNRISSADERIKGKSLYMAVDIDHETTAMTIGRGDIILMTRTAPHPPGFHELADGWHGALRLPDDELEQLAGFISSDIQSSLQYYSMIDRTSMNRVYVTGRFKQLDDIIRILHTRDSIPYIKPELFPALTGIDKAQFSTCISLAVRGLENERG